MSFKILFRMTVAVRIKQHFPRTFLCVVNMTDDAQSLAEQSGTSVHATEALLCNLREQKIKQAASTECAMFESNVKRTTEGNEGALSGQALSPSSRVLHH
jgi:hypothetical protein